MAARQFGIALQDALGGLDPAFSQQIVAPEPAPKQGLSKGQIIAGIIGDMLAQVGGGKAVFAPMMAQQREQEQEDVRWSRRQQAEDEQWQRRQEWQLTHPEPSAMERNLQTWQGWTPDQRTAYSAMQEANGNDFVTMTLPNGQFYAGPRSGIISALQGAAPQRPQVGAVVPDPRKAGGPVPQAPATFR